MKELKAKIEGKEEDKKVEKEESDDDDKESDEILKLNKKLNKTPASKEEAHE